ncbi:MAG TPA: VOC family protein [Solirubrobacteraceae bacterium]|jgi:catechol 2,3-dioxygenase-like lactoylglutathione lyase family enzyme|nr:VOC family protein [Solirubrobacteraceae bacterium]
MRAATPAPKIIQVALCSSALTRSVRLYCEAFGFADAGGRTFWGEWLARVQGLGTEAETILWWLVGRQDYFQLEFFNHTQPRQRPIPDDWRASDHGWVRWGLAVPDFDDALARLDRLGVEPMTEPMSCGGLRRVCFRDPEVGVVVEVMEEGRELPGGIRPRHYDLVPAVVYAAVSVPDLDRARTLYVDTVGLVAEPETVLHPPELEALWGLEGARRKSFVARGGDIYLEVVEYEEPVGRPKPPGYRLSDQGFMNIAIGLRDRDSLEELIARLAANGHEANHSELPPPPSGGTYITDADGISLEVFAAPREFDEEFGFRPQATFGHPGLWPHPGVGPAG